MRLLVLGGTRFIGRHLVEMALERGDQVTLFNRGKTDPDAHPGVEQAHGDRADGVGALGRRSWDAVIDISCYVADWARRSVEETADAGHYVFVSTVSVYSKATHAGMDEDGPVFAPDWEGGEVTAERYGPMKVASEMAVRERRPGATIIRPGIVTGPGDYMDRFTYWVRRVSQGGEVLAPGEPGRPLQMIDARDLAAWMLRAATERIAGTFNAVGPERPATFGEMLETVRAATNSDARFTWVSDDFLREHGYVAGPDDLPLWLDVVEEEHFFSMSNRRAVEAGLNLRSLAETARDVAAWEGTYQDPRPRPAGITREREAELLAAWHARDGR
jgi:2'-hydroxyisoflavone reductase